MAPALAHHEEWTGRDVSTDEIERRLAALRRDERDVRTSVMTHLAWVPPEWRERARETLAGLAERHPSRTILLFPEDAEQSGLDAQVSLECFVLPGMERHVCWEVIELTLKGDAAHAPGSIVAPLVLPDLPVFLRWRGRPAFGAPELEQLVDLADRLVVDSAEWPDVPDAYAQLSKLFERVAVSDIAWSRTEAWRRAVADAWPDVPRTVAGPPAEAALVAGWLRSRAGAEVRGEDVDEPAVACEESASELLSRQLDRFGRDRIYEEAVAAATSPPAPRFSITT